MVNIDLERTGLHLKNLIHEAGYDVRDIQEYLQLSCPQPIYRWFKGKTLPSLVHLLALSELLGMHMEELLVREDAVLQPAAKPCDRCMSVFRTVPIEKEDIAWSAVEGLMSARLSIYYKRLKSCCA